MRTVLVCLWIMLFTACASLSHRPTDLQPAVVLSTEQAPPQAKTEPLWSDCFDRALASAPGLVPRMAQDCCLSSRTDPDVLAWCQRHMSMLKDRDWGGDQDQDPLAVYHRWIRERFFCHMLKDQKARGNYPTTDAEVAVQCRLSDSIGTYFKPKPDSTAPPRQ